MVFLIQNSQNRDTGAIQTKLDELIRALEGAHNALLDLEELDEDEIEHVRRDYRQLAADARKAIEKGMKDTACAEVAHCEETAEEAKAAKKKPPRQTGAQKKDR
jgi:low affinity Fe/Cu permease